MEKKADKPVLPKSKMMLLLLTLQSFSFVIGYDFTCPHESQWNARSSSICGDKLHYNCLWNVIKFRYDEYCGYDEFSRQGFKYVLLPNPQQVPCSEQFYQPISFTSKENSRCIYQKSECSGEGQIVGSNGTGDSDRKCRCDYTRNFMFVSQPENGCTCVPSQEDCSCSNKPCNSEKEELQRDYICRKKQKVILPENVPCEDIKTGIQKSDKQYNKEIYTARQNAGLIIERVSSTFIQAVIMIMLVVQTIIAVLLIGVFPSVGVITITTDSKIKSQENSNSFKVLYGDNVVLKCGVTSNFGIKSVKWYIMQQGKMYEIDASNRGNKYVMSGTNIRSLKINTFSSEDLGMYFCKVENCIGLSNESLLRFSAMLSRFRFMSPVIEFLKEFSELPAEEDTKIEVFACIKKDMKTHIHGTDVELKVLVDDLSDDVTKIIWLKLCETLRIIDPDETRDKYSRGSCDDPSLIVKDCSVADSGDYICIMLDSEEGVVRDSYLLYHLEVMLKPSRNFPEQWIQKAELHDVVKYVKDEMLVNVKGEKTHAQRETRFRILFQRLANESMENIKDVQSLFQEIYNFWLKEFDSYASKNDKRGKAYFPAWNLILFLENLISCENTGWIFEKEMMSFVILCGLILSAKNSLLTRQNNLFMLFFKQFQHKLQSEESKDFFKDMSTYLDPFGNTFFHYIVLFGSPEAIIILNKNNELLTEDTSFWKCNRRNLNPLQLSAFLGKAIVFRSLFIKTKNLNKKIDGLKHFVRKGLEELDGRLDSADDSKSTSQKSLVTEKGNSSSSKNRQVSVIANHFETEVLKCVVYGTKAEYLELLELLSKSKIKEDIVAQELKKEFIKSDILRKYLIMSE